MKNESVKHMKLQDFVSETLLQVIYGVQTAQNELFKNDCPASINPETTRLKDEITDLKYNMPVSHMKFDVSVTVQDQKETEGGIGIIVGSITLGSKGKSGESNNIFSRIQFDVPITLPVPPKNKR